MNLDCLFIEKQIKWVTLKSTSYESVLGTKHHTEKK